MKAHFLLVGLVVVFAMVACAGEVSSPTGSLSDAPVADEALPPAGVPDRGDDPAVVAIDTGGVLVCSGALVAPDAVLTSRRCASVTAMAACPDGSARTVTSLAPQSLRILVGDQVTGAEERARGRQIIVPDGDPECGPDIAIVLLDTPIDDIEPLAVRTTGAAKGDPLRTAGYVNLGGSAGPVKRVRDNALVVDLSPAELHIGEACSAGAGGPAIDAATADIVAIASRSGTSGCGGAGAFDVYVRADAFLTFIEGALDAFALAPGSAAGKAKTAKGDVDVGAPCVQGGDCAAGVCATDGAREYCSRTCDAYDRCPPRWRCKLSAGGAWICAD